ncbi:MAG: nucleotidyltransferase family protein [Acidobacteria bacterium]|nr:nucleotidyltransferase family protein [Acidobacteriota bacterium]
MLAAIILAAGDSTRMGEPKALLLDSDGRPFVARLVRTFAEAQVQDIIIVTGRQHDAIVGAVVADGPPVTPRFVTNPRPSLGQLFSLRVGLDAAEVADVDGVLVTPVDIPMFQSSTIRELARVWEQRRPPIARPAVGDRHGHPVLFDRAAFDALRCAPLDLGARGVVHAWSDRLVNVQVSDEGCLMDIDTPADYAAIVGRTLGPP